MPISLADFARGIVVTDLVTPSGVTFPAMDEQIKENLNRLEGVPRMTTPVIGGTINYAVSLMPDDQCFVNVGVWGGYMLLAGALGNNRACFGVDNFSQFSGSAAKVEQAISERRLTERVVIFGDDFREYFAAKHRASIGVYIYDAMHTFKDQYEGLELADPFIVPGGYIIVDDTDWPEPLDATMQFVTDNGGYELVFSANGGIENRAWWNGISILRKMT